MVSFDGNSWFTVVDQLQIYPWDCPLSPTHKTEKKNAKTFLLFTGRLSTILERERERNIPDTTKVSAIMEKGISLFKN